MKYLILLALLASCAPLRTYTDVVRVYGKPVEIDTLPHHYTHALFPDGSGKEEFAFDSLNRVAWHWTAPENIEPPPHF